MGVEPGKHYGYRKQRYAIGKPLRPVLVTKLGPPKSYKCRVRWLDGEYEGLDEWVRTDTLLCPWESADAFIEDEVRLARVVEASAHAYKTTEWLAVREVLWKVETPFELSEWVRHEGLVMIEDFPANIADCGFDPAELVAEPLAFIDRHGTYHGSFSTALRIAQRLCKQHPERIITDLKLDIQAYKKAAKTGWYASPHGGRGWDISLGHAQKQVEEHLEILKIVSPWCGHEFAEKFDVIAGLQEEVARLRLLLTETLDWMRDTAEEQKLRWLKAKYTKVYQELNGEAPPSPKRRARSPKPRLLPPT